MLVIRSWNNATEKKCIAACKRGYRSAKISLFSFFSILAWLSTFNTGDCINLINYIGISYLVPRVCYFSFWHPHSVHHEFHKKAETGLDQLWCCPLLQRWCAGKATSGQWGASKMAEWQWIGQELRKPLWGLQGCSQKLPLGESFCKLDSSLIMTKQKKKLQYTHWTAAY